MVPMKNLSAAALLLALAALAACGSSPKTQYFALQPEPASGPRRDMAGPPLTVSAVRLPAMLDRLELVQLGIGNNVDIQQERRWAAPLDQMSRLVLARDLALRLPQGMVLAPDEPKPGGNTRAVVVNVEQFDADAIGRVTLDGSWSLLDGQGRQVEQRRHEHIEIDGEHGQAAAMSRALAELSDRMVAVIGSSRSSTR